MWHSGALRHFEFVLATFHWCQSPTILWIIEPIFDFSTLISLYRSPLWSPRWCIGWECFSSSTSASLFWGTTVLFVYSSFWVISTLDVLVLLSTLEIVLANIHWDVLVLLNVADVHQCSKVDFPCLLLWCAFFMTSFHSFFHCCLCIWNEHCWRERSFVHASRFPEVCVSERHISRVFWTISNSRFLKFTEQNNIQSSYSFLPRFTLESISCSPDFQGYSKNFVSQVRCAARRDNVRLLSPFEKIRWRAFLRSFHRNEFARKVLCNTEFRPFPAIPIRPHVIRTKCHLDFRHAPPGSKISSRRSFL